MQQQKVTYIIVIKLEAWIISKYSITSKIEKKIAQNVIATLNPRQEFTKNM